MTFALREMKKAQMNKLWAILIVFFDIKDITMTNYGYANDQLLINIIIYKS